MFKSVKSTLADYLKSQIEFTYPTHIDMKVIDGFYFLYLVGSSMPQTFGQIAQSILIKFCATSADVLIILLGNIHKVPDMDIWLTGTKSKKTKKDVSCINCTQLAAKLGPIVCRAFPAFHAFTGCDYSAAFYNKGKVRPFKIFFNNNKFQTVFASLTDVTDVFDDENMLRTIFIKCMWPNATEPCCVKFHPEEYGWSVIDGNLKPTWFMGDPTSMTVAEILLASKELTLDEHQQDIE